MQSRVAARARVARTVAFAVGVTAAATAALPAAAIDLVPAEARASSALPQGIAPNPLMTIDLNRATVVEGIVTTWGDALADQRAGLTKDQLRILLSGLRSDQLLAASLAGTLDGLRNVVANAVTATGPAAPALFHAKALGSATSDLVYTPITPCRIIDSRSSAGGVLQSGQVRNWLAANPAGNFVAQGGSASDCGIPVKPGAVLINLTLANTTGASNFLSAWPFNVAQPNTAVVNWTAPNQQIANAVIIPLCVGAGCTSDFSTFASSQTDLIGDALGYFAAPSGGGGGGVTSVTASAPLASSGGAAPNISLTGSIPVANGGTGVTSLPTNGVVVGQGTGAVTTAVGSAGQVFTGTAGAPLWTASPSIGGNLNLVASTSTAGNILKGGNLFLHSFGTNNTFVGELAGNVTMTGAQNTSIGRNTLQNNTTGGNNTASGAFVLQSNTTGNNNTASGANAMQSNTTGCCNVGVGQAALSANVNGNGNTAVGGSALQNNTSGNSNTATGQAALLGNTIGVGNTGLGQGALQTNVSGNQNTAVGLSALQSNTASGNTAVGAGALTSNTTGSGNIAVGGGALNANTTGGNNSALGQGALSSNTTGSGNTAVGGGALQSSTTGASNAAFGANALQDNTTGFNNTASGQAAMQNNTTGCCNTASGQLALHGNTTGSSNSAFGGSALQSNVTGSGNAAFGQAALANSTAGNGNAAFGQGALNGNTGGNNIAVGQNAGNALTTGNFNIAIGNAGVAAEANTIRIGDNNQSRTFVAGIRGVTTGVNDAITVVIDSAGQLGTLSSSRRYKDDIADMDEASAALMKLRPVTFRYKADRDPFERRLQYGLIAEEVAEIYPGMVARLADGQVETVMYQFLPPMLLNEYQKQQRTIAAQAAALSAQATRIAGLELEHAAQVARIAELERDRRAQVARIDALEQERLAVQAQAAEIAALKRQMAEIAELQARAARLEVAATK